MSSSERIRQDNEVFCKQCGKIIFANAEICPHCGVRQIVQPNTLKKVNKTRQIVWSVVIGILGLIFILTISVNSIPKVIVDKQEVIQDGYVLTYTLPTGNCLINVISDQPIIISYDIAQQENTTELNSYNRIVNISDGEKLHIQNPTFWGFGPVANISVKIIKH